MPTFKNLKQLERFAKKKLAQTITSTPVLDTFRRAMIESVETEVYDYYQPTHYERRYDDGGLSDPRNMVFTSQESLGNVFSADFENLTTGSNQDVYGYPVDSNYGHFISETIENGSKNKISTPNTHENGWYDPSGEWADPRPFAKATSVKLNETTHNAQLKNALQQGINS